MFEGANTTFFVTTKKFLVQAHNYLCICLLNHILARNSIDCIRYKKKKREKT